MYKNIDTKFKPKVRKIYNYLPHFSASIARKELYLDFELNIEKKLADVVLELKISNDYNTDIYWNEFYSEDLNLELETKIAKPKNWTQIMIKQQN